MQKCKHGPRSPEPLSFLLGVSPADDRLDQVDSGCHAAYEKQKEPAQRHSALSVKHDRDTQEDKAQGNKAKKPFFHVVNPPDQGIRYSTVLLLVSCLGHVK